MPHRDLTPHSAEDLAPPGSPTAPSVPGGNPAALSTFAAQALLTVEVLSHTRCRVTLPEPFAVDALLALIGALDPSARVILGPADFVHHPASLTAGQWALEASTPALTRLGLLTDRSTSTMAAPRALVIWPRPTLTMARSMVDHLRRALERVKPEERDETGRLRPWIPTRQATRGLSLEDDAELIDAGAPLPEPEPDASDPASSPAADHRLDLDDHTLTRWFATLCRAAGLATPPPLTLRRGHEDHHGLATGRVWFERQGLIRRVHVTTCPNSDLADVLATFAHELAHPLARSTRHDGPMRRAMLDLVGAQFGRRFFAACESALPGPMATLDAWVATCIRAALKDAPPPAARPLDDGQAARVLSRLRKLRALARDQRGRPEGISATALANDLAITHGLAFGAEVDLDLDDSRVVDRFVKLEDGAVWRRLLAHDIARYFDVFALSLPHKGELHFFGEHGDVLAAEYLYSVSARRIERECEAHIAAFKRRRGKTTSAETRREKTSFCDSAAVAFGKKLTGYRTEAADADGSRLERAERIAEEEHARRGTRWSSSGKKTYRENAAGQAVGASMEVLRGVTGEAPLRLR